MGFQTCDECRLNKRLSGKTLQGGETETIWVQSWYTWQADSQNLYEVTSIMGVLSDISIFCCNTHSQGRLVSENAPVCIQFCFS